MATFVNSKKATYQQSTYKATDGFKRSYSQKAGSSNQTKNDQVNPTIRVTSAVKKSRSYSQKLN